MNKKFINPAKILLTNDDGIAGRGMRDLFMGIYREYSITIVAPDRERSGTGHAFTINNPINYEKRNYFDDVEAFIVSGTPVDCVKFALSYLLPEKPSIIVAGLNIGENSGLSAFYSGTVAAAREGAFWGIPSIAFSLCGGGERYAKGYIKHALYILKWVLSREYRFNKKHKIFYNVNFPACSPERSMGIKITTQSLAFFDDRYETIEMDSNTAKKGYFVYGNKKDLEKSNNYDSRALMNDYITITPLHYDATAHNEYMNLKKEKIAF